MCEISQIRRRLALSGGHQETVRAEADRVGAAVIFVTVDRDPNVGLRAIVRAAVGAEKMKEALDRYAFRSDVSQG